MNTNEFAKLAMDNHSFMCYIVDMETYELLYANETAMTTFMPFAQDFIPGKTCYNFLHGFDAPCIFCNNHLLKPKKKLFSEIQNLKNNKFYSHIDVMLIEDGKKLKITYAYDSSVQKEQIESLAKKLTIEETLTKCVQTLVEDSELDTAIQKLLSIVGEFYEADRAYLFEVDEEANTAKNSYEWCVTPKLATIDTNPLLGIEELAPILGAFRKDGEMIISDINTELDVSGALYKLLNETESYSLHLAPIYSEGKITYFMGVDNPKANSKDSTLLHSVIIFVTDEIKKYKVLKQLERLSYTDALTGLQNRNKYLQRLQEINPQELSSIGFIQININELKRMNELYGETYGDNILQQATKLFTRFLPEDFFRLSGDEFIALCINISQTDFDKLILNLRNASSEQGEFSFAVGGVWQDKKINIRQGLTQANDVMLSEKQNFYRSKTSNTIQSRLNPVEILLGEIRDNFFTIYLQPKVKLSSGKIAGAEALVRKFTKDGKMIPPDRFIPIYENEGSIKHLDFFVLEQVCILLETLLRENRAIPIAVNFSRVSCLAYDVIEEIVSICDKYAIPHNLIKIELTESIDKMDFDFYHKKIQILREHGFEISLDDFGAKHSNLVMLTMAEFTEVKIDKGLIDNITTSAENRTVVRNVIKTVKELGKSSCVAEGIEKEEQVTVLEDFGCDYVQGYYFYRPMPVKDFLSEYDKNRETISEDLKMIGDFIGKAYDISYDELYSIIQFMPLCVNLWNNKRENFMSNRRAAELFDLENEREYLEKFSQLSPEYQPDGKTSRESSLINMNEARNKGYHKFNWMHCKLNGELMPCEITLVKLDVKSEDGDFLIAGFTRDLRSQIAGTNEEDSATAYFFNEVSDKTLFNVISEISEEFFWTYSNKLKTIQFFGKGRRILALPERKMKFPEEIYENNIIPDEWSDIFMDFTHAMEKGRCLPIELEFNLPNGKREFFRIDYRIILDNNHKPLFSIGKTAVIPRKEEDGNSISHSYTIPTNFG